MTVFGHRAVVRFLSAGLSLRAGCGEDLFGVSAGFRFRFAGAVQLAWGPVLWASGSGRLLLVTGYFD